MCDCYDHQCNNKGCKVRLPVHLGDFATKRNEVQVFCEDHLPDKDVRVFTFKKRVKEWYFDPSLNGSLKCMGIRYLTANAHRHACQNSPNVGEDYAIEIRDTLGRRRLLTESRDTHLEGLRMQARAKRLVRASIPSCLSN